jgi:hypothetical protein
LLIIRVGKNSKKGCLRGFIKPKPSFLELNPVAAKT